MAPVRSAGNQLPQGWIFGASRIERLADVEERVALLEVDLDRVDGLLRRRLVTRLRPRRSAAPCSAPRRSPAAARRPERRAPRGGRRRCCGTSACVTTAQTPGMRARPFACRASGSRRSGAASETPCVQRRPGDADVVHEHRSAGDVADAVVAREAERRRPSCRRLLTATSGSADRGWPPSASSKLSPRATASTASRSSRIPCSGKRARRARARMSATGRAGSRCEQARMRRSTMPGRAEAALCPVAARWNDGLERVTAALASPRPSTVVISAPSAAASGSRHERRGSPSTSTVHAPQLPCWQPAFGPVMSRSSRRTSEQRRSGGALDLARDAVDSQLHRASSRSASARATTVGRTRARYQRGCERIVRRARRLPAPRSPPPPRACRRPAAASTDGHRRPCGPAPVTATRTVPFVLVAVAREDRVVVGVRPPRRPRTRSCGKRRHRRCRARGGRRRRPGNPRPARCARRRRRWSGPARRARSAAPAGPRGERRRPPPSRGCRRRSPDRVSRDRPRDSAAVASGSSPPSSAATEQAAPIVTAPFARVSPSSPLRASMTTRLGLSRPCVSSGTTIVPPPTTVTPSPSPKASAASAGVVGRTTSKLLAPLVVGRHVGCGRF